MRLDLHVHCNVADPAAAAELVRTCEKLSTRAALSGGSRYGSHDYAPNDYVLGLSKQYPDWILPMARFDLWETAPDPAAVHRLAEQGFRGLKCIYPFYPYDHDSYMPVYAAASQCRLPILFHTGNYRPSEADARWQRPVLTNMSPLTLDRIARSFPDLKIVMAHLGTTFWRLEAAELIKLHPNLYSDLAGCGSWMALAPETLVKLLSPTIPLLDSSYRGFRKLVLGSDAYVNIPGIMADAQAWYDAFCRKIGLPEDVAKGIMGDTAADWFKA